MLAQVQRTAVRPMRQRRGNLLEVTVGDGSGGALTLTFFGNQAWRERELRPGRWGLFAGKVTEFRGKRQLNGPEYVLLGERTRRRGGGQRRDRGVRRRADPGLPGRRGRADLGDRPLRAGGAGHRAPPPDDPLPAARAGQPRTGRTSATALREIHRPSSREALHRARRRLKWDEAFAVQLTLVQRKHAGGRLAGAAPARRAGRPAGRVRRAGCRTS